MAYSKKFLAEIYRTMLRIRYCEESLVGPIIKKEIKTPCHLYTGQEAVAAGVSAALDKKDYVFGNHRSHGHYLAKGGNLNALVAEIFGKIDGCSRGRGGSMHIIDKDSGFLGATPIIAGTASLAVGAALASKMRKDGRVAVNFFGDGARAEGAISEALNFSALHKLPIIFVCENNLYATHMPIRESLSNTKIYETAKGYKVYSVRTDGNDVLKVFELAKKLADRARKGKGPVFMECLTYRMRGHVGPDDNIQGAHSDIRGEKEVERWRKKDPIKRFEKYLMKNKVLNKNEMESVYKNTEREIKEAHLFAQKSAYPSGKELLKYVFYDF